MSTFVAIPAEVLRAQLLSFGFERVFNVSAREEVYDRAHKHDPRYHVRIYTTIPAGNANVRACGKDAIRIVVVFFDVPGSRGAGIYKATRVFRAGTVETVLDRVHKRLREAYAFVNERLKSGMGPRQQHLKLVAGGKT